MATRLPQTLRRVAARRATRFGLLAAVLAASAGAIGVHADSLVGTGYPWKSATLPLNWPHAASGSASWTTGGTSNSVAINESIQAGRSSNQSWQQVAAQMATSGWCMEPSTKNPALDCSMIPSTLSVSIDGFTLPNEALATGIHAAASDLRVPAAAPAALATGVALAIENLIESQEAIRQKLVADPSTVQNLLDWQLQQYKTEPASQLPPLPEPADQYYSDPKTYRIFAAMVTRAQVQWQILGNQRNAPRSAQRRALYAAWLDQVLPLHRVVITGMPVGYSITNSLPPIM